MFPNGLGYDKPNDRVQTTRENTIFSVIPSLSIKIENIKKGEPIPLNQFSDLVTSKGQSSNFLTDDINLIISQSISMKVSLKI